MESFGRWHPALSRGAIALAMLLSGPVLGKDVMQACEPGNAKYDMQCVNRNGVCLDMEIDGQATTPIGREERERLSAIQLLEDVCWQVSSPVSAAMRVQAKAGGIGPDFVGPVESISAQVYPIKESDRDVDALDGYELKPDGDPAGMWQLKLADHARTPGARSLPPGEYVVVFRVFGKDNWDRQGVLLRIDPKLKPAIRKP